MDSGTKKITNVSSLLCIATKLCTYNRVSGKWTHSTKCCTHHAQHSQTKTRDRQQKTADTEKARSTTKGRRDNTQRWTRFVNRDLVFWLPSTNSLVMWGSAFADLAKKAHDLQEQAKEQASHIAVRNASTLFLPSLFALSLTSSSNSLPAFSISMPCRVSHPISQQLSLRRHNPRFHPRITRKRYHKRWRGNLPTNQRYPLVLRLSNCRNETRCPN